MEAPPVTPTRIAQIKEMFYNVSRLGIKQEFVALCANLLNNHVTSTVADEIRLKLASEEQISQMKYIFEVEPKFDFDFEQQFLLGVKVILNGIKTL